MGVYVNRIRDKMSERHLNWSTDFDAALADLERIPGASETNLSKAFRNLKELDDVKTAVPLDVLLGRFVKMAEVFRPFKLQLDDPAQALQLLKDYESGALAVSVSRQEPGALIHAVYIIESDPNKLFAGIQNGEPGWGTEPLSIKDRQIAVAAVRLLSDIG